MVVMCRIGNVSKVTESSVSLPEIYNKVRMMGHISSMFTNSSENKSFCSVLANFIEWQVCFKIKRRRKHSENLLNALLPSNYFTHINLIFLEKNNSVWYNYDF